MTSPGASPRSGGTQAQRQLLLALAVLAAVLVAFWLGRGSVGSDGSAGPSGGTAASSGASGGNTERPVPSSGSTPSANLPRVTPGELPAQGRTTIRLIHAGGPFPYTRDGATFQNRERLLPQRDRGYYREYTVPTPGEDDRGARRIVAGERGDLYYTADHYDSFRQIELGTDDRGTS